MTRLHGAAKAAHERRILRDAVEREVTAALAHTRRRDPGAIPAALRHLRRAEVLQEMTR